MIDFALQARAIEERDPAIAIPVRYTEDDISRFSNPNYRSTDWFREVYDRTSYQTRHNISLRGGSEMFSYFTSLGVGSGRWRMEGYGEGVEGEGVEGEGAFLAFDHKSIPLSFIFSSKTICKINYF